MTDKPPANPPCLAMSRFISKGVVTPATLEAEAGGPGVQDLVRLQSEFNASLGYLTTSCLKLTSKRERDNSVLEPLPDIYMETWAPVPRSKGPVLILLNMYWAYDCFDQWYMKM